MNYFDHAASSIIYPEVLEILSIAEAKDFANPSAQHSLGHDLNEKIEEFRAAFLQALGAKNQDNFVFTSSATESNNTVIKGLKLIPGDIVVYCKADHPSITAPVEFLALESGVQLREITLNADGDLDLDLFGSLIDEKVKLVVLCHVNNQSGVIYPIETLARLIKEKSTAHIHVDAVQSFGKIHFKLTPEIDSLSFSSHKLGGPKGIAGLFLKANHQVRPLLLGGGQENGFRSSTVAYPLVAGFHAAMKLSLAELSSSFSKTANSNEIIRAKLSMAIPSIQFPFKLTSPYIVSFILPGISSDIILRHLESRQVYISSTSACSSKKTGFNPTLAAMNIPEKFHKNFLRISLGPKTSESEVEVLIHEFISVWESIKHMLNDGRGR